jgi:ribonuclease P protein component
LRLRPSQRIRRHADFQEIYKTGARISSRYCTLFIKPSRSPAGRLGIAATKKLGGAVDRNRAKRLIREIFRHNDIAPGFDIIVVPKREFLEVSLAVLEADYRSTLERRPRRSSR